VFISGRWMYVLSVYQWKMDVCIECLSVEDGCMY